MTKSICKIDEWGDKYWRNEKGKLHLEDGPAIEFSNGDKEWRYNGKRHRTDGPAIEYDDGTKEWMVNDKHHREDGPAIEYNDGLKFWYYNGVHYDVTSVEELLVAVLLK